MTGARRRGGFCLLLAALAILLFFFGTAYLLWMLLVFLALAGAGALLIRKDAGHVAMEAAVSHGAKPGETVQLTVTAGASARLLAAGTVCVEVELRNQMFGITSREQMILPLHRRGESLSASLPVRLCGEIAFTCVSARVWDCLGLFAADCAPFSEVRTVCYPARMDAELLLSGNSVGAVNAEGLMQNRKGADPSEIFDVREYAPGDDVRSIHWKLSSKTDTLILRESSEPRHYDMVLLPDLGLYHREEAVSFDELNSAAALTAALGAQLLQKRVSFCFAIPGKQGLLLQEVRDQREYQRLLTQWMGAAIPGQSGVGLHVFLSEHLQQYFTRLLIVSAGKYGQDISGLEKRIGVTVVSTDDSIREVVYTRLGTDKEAVVVPSVQPSGDRYKIVC